MTRGLYTAYTGMLAQQQKLDTISNNLANVNTAAFKKDSVVFESFEQMYMSRINDPEEPGVHRIGKATFGVKVGEIFSNFEQGPLQQTDDPLNLALDGSGMFAVGTYDKEGNLIEKYTRDGSFGLNSKGQVVTKDGYFLLGENGPITLNSNDVRIIEDGKILDGSTKIDQIKIMDFENTNTMKKVAGGIFEKTEATNAKEFSGKVVQGFIEGSNVNSIEEMVNMINVMRTYESNQKIISTYDETMGKAVNEVGRI